MRPHEKLDVWNKSMDLVLTVYKATESFPKEKRFGLTSQIRRAAVSIPANIAEGAARNSRREFVHFLSNAQGSASELETEWLLAHRLGYLAHSTHDKIKNELESVGRMIFGLSQNVRNRMTT